MPSSSDPPGAGYWYSTESGTADSVDVLNALRAYREAEKSMRRRTREAMKMNETDLLAIRFVMRARRAGESISPKDLARLLGISTASTTALIDRLEASGHLTRQRHPTDRRALEIIPTADADSEVRRTLGQMHARMLAVAEGLPGKDAHTITVFLQAMALALQQDDAGAEARNPTQ